MCNPGIYLSSFPAPEMVVHCKMAPFDVYIGRPSKWGNPFIVGRDGDRQEVIEKYGGWIINQPELMRALPELQNKVLGCWCWPKKCHGQVLVELVAELPNIIIEVSDEKT